MHYFLRRPLTTTWNKNVETRSYNWVVYCFVKHFYNRYDVKKAETLGPNKAAAQWLLRCAATFRPKGHEKFVSTKKQLRQLPPNFVIESIDASDSVVYATGFEYLKGLKDLKELKLYFCHWVNGDALTKVGLYCQDSLERLELVSCGDVTTSSLMSLHTLKKLKVLYLCGLIQISKENRVVVVAQLSHYLGKKCQIVFPDIKMLGDMYTLRPK